MRRFTKWQVMGGAFLAGLVLMGVGGGVAFAEYSDFQYMGQKYIQSGEERQYSQTITIPEDVQKVVLYQSEYGQTVIDESIPEGQIKVDVTYWGDSKTMGNNLHVEERRQVFLPYNGTLEQQIPVYTVQVYWWGSGVDEWAAFQELLHDVKNHEFYSYDYRPTTYTYTMSSATQEKVWLNDKMPSGDIMYAEEAARFVQERDRQQSEDALAREWEELERQREELEMQREQLETDTVTMESVSDSTAETATGTMQEQNYVDGLDGDYHAVFNDFGSVAQWPIYEGYVESSVQVTVDAETELWGNSEIELVVMVDDAVVQSLLMASNDQQHITMEIPEGHCVVYLQSERLKGKVDIDFDRLDR